MVLVYHMILQDHAIKVHLNLWVKAHQGNLPFCQVWWP